MKYAILACAVVLVALLIWRRDNRSAPTAIQSQEPSVATAEEATANVPQRLHSPAPLAVLGHSTSATGTTDDLQIKAATLTHEWARAAKPFNFDPIITGYQNQTNRRGDITVVGVITRTHFVEMFRRSDGDIIAVANSSYESDRTTPEHEGDWYQCTGKWTEQEAVAETRAILERLGATRTLTNIARHTYEAMPLQLATPERKTVSATPFVVVEFYTGSGKRIVEAQYRMGATGPAGLVRWWHWP